MAATLAELYKFEETLETGFTALIAEVTTNVYYRRSTESKASPYADVLIQVGPAMPHEHWKDSEKEENIFEATLQICICSSRSKSGQNATHHTMIGLARAAVLSSDAGYNSTNFPDLAVLTINSLGSSFEVDQETNLDKTTLDFSFVFEIRSTAYPS